MDLSKLSMEDLQALKSGDLSKVSMAGLQAMRPAKAEPVSDFSGNLRFGPIDTGIALPEGVNKRLAQMGSGIDDWRLGLKQRFGGATPEDVADKRKVDASLNDDLTGKVLNFGGKVLPAFAVPAAGVVGGAAGGAAMGFAEPTAEGESALTNTLVGGTLGAAIPGAVAGVKRMLKPNAETATLAREAVAAGIPVGAADMSSNKLVKGLRSVLNDTPFVGSIGAAQNKAKQAGFQSAVGGTFGAKSLDAAEVASAKGRVTGELDRVWNNNALKLDGDLIVDFQRIGERASSLAPEQQATVVKQMQKLLVKADEAQIPGSYANNWQSELRLAAEGEKGLAKDILNDLRQSTIKAFNRSVGPEDAAALTKARTQYKNFKTVSPLLNKSEVGVAGREAGDIAALLPGAVAERGTPELKQLAKLGSRFVVDRTSQTGGSPRAFLQNGIIGSALTTSGGLSSLPMAAVSAAGSAGTNWMLGSPRVAKGLLSQEPVRGLLGSPQMTPAMLEALRKSLYLSTAGSPALLE